MKKTILAIATSLVATASMADITPFVALERETSAATNRAIVGVNTNFGDLDVETKYSWTSTNNMKFEGEKVDVDLIADFGGNVQLYMKNELSKTFKHQATTVGLQISF